MSKNLVVVLGAGASYDCVGPNTPKNKNFTPPLLPDLFSNKPSFVEIQSNYPLVSSAASEIRAYTQDSRSVEQYIREKYRDSEIQDDKKTFFEIPLYLQHLLFAVSQNYTLQPDNLNILVNQLNRLKSVVYITLNYDLILDNRLSSSFALSNLDSYIDTRKSWLLVKLHGSVNWGYEANVPEGARHDDYFRGAFAKLYGSLESGSKKIVFRAGRDLNTIRFQETPPRLYYPALSVPVGTKGERACPKEHIDLLISKLETMNEINLLVIGYSGNDVEVIELLSEKGIRLKALKVVNGSLKTARVVIQKLSEKLKFVPNEEMAYDNTFNNFVRDGSLQRFLSSI